MSTLQIIKEHKAAKDNYLCLGMRNTNGLTLDERYQLDRDYKKAGDRYHLALFEYNKALSD